MTTDSIELNAQDFGHEAYVEWIDQGVYVSADVPTLIQELRLPPFAAAWFQAVVHAVLDKFGVKAKVEKSTLSVPAEY